jgi:sn-glycerol 3-phosphate transport system permease protein
LFALLVAPNLLFLAVFTYRPLLRNIELSFYRWDLISPVKQWVGLDNYLDWIRDPNSHKAIVTTVIFTVATVLGSMLLGLGLAILLHKRFRGRGFVRSVLFAPYVVSGAAVGIVWLFVFDPRYGLLAAGLDWLGVSSPNWYNDPAWALAMVIIVYVWKNVGYVTVVYLAGLQSIPRELYEAAEVDGASSWARFRAVTIPGLSSITFFLGVTTFLAAMQAFDIIHVMTRGGPLDGTKTMVYQVYEEGFVRFRVGLASAVATVLFLVMLVVTLAQVRLVERRVNYA